MLTRTERLLLEFVNRDTELSRFSEMLDASGCHVFAIWGPGGLGKSSLMARLLDECGRKGVRTAMVEWDDQRSHDYLATMRRIRDQLGPKQFPRFNDRVNFYTVPQYELNVNIHQGGPIHVAEGAHIEGSDVGDIAGVIVKDLNIYDTRTDMDVPESERRLRLTADFLTDLEQYLAAGPLVVFLDASEKMLQDTREWVWGQLLRPLTEGKLRGARFVVAGRQKPEYDRDMSFLVQEAELQPLQQEHIEEYLTRRGVLSEHVEELATMLLAIAEGVPLNIALYTDSYLRQKEAAAS